MAQKETCVGVVGADAEAGWAKISHIPAINGLPGLKLAAVATRNEQSPRQAAEPFGADRWFSNPFAMIHDDQIEIITIAVNVPAHRELVLAALGAGKAVYCEAFLASSVAESEEMARTAGSLHAAIGLQGRLNPAVRRAVELISCGKIGRLLSANVVSTTTGFGPEMPSSHEIFNKKSSGADRLTITAGHTLDTVEALLGSVIEVDARMETVWPVVRLTDTGEHSSLETADHVGVVGKTRSGALFTARIHGGAAPENARFVFKVTGTEGWLRLMGGPAYGFQVGDLKLASNIDLRHPTSPQCPVRPAARRSTWERSTLIFFAICMRAPIAHPALTTHFTTPVLWRLYGAPLSEASGNNCRNNRLALLE